MRSAKCPKRIKEIQVDKIRMETKMSYAETAEVEKTRRDRDRT